jgi:hypothetical protein
MNALRELYNALDEGQKIYLANKLYKEDRNVAQKVKSFIPLSVLEKPAPLEHEVGDLVLVEAHVIDTAPEAPYFQYAVALDDGDPVWVPAGLVKGKSQ